MSIALIKAVALKTGDLPGLTPKDEQDIRRQFKSSVPRAHVDLVLNAFRDREVSMREFNTIVGTLRWKNRTKAKKYFRSIIGEYHGRYLKEFADSLKLFKSRNWKDRKRALMRISFACRQIRYPAGINALIAGLNDPYYEVVWQAIKSLKYLDVDVATVKRILILLKKGSKDSRITAAQTLTGDMMEKHLFVVKALIKSLKKDPSEDVRSSIAYNVNEAVKYQQTIITALIRASKHDRHKKVLEAAINTLRCSYGDDKRVKRMKLKGPCGTIMRDPVQW